MITTVTLNAAIDKTYYMPQFMPGKLSRIDRVYAEAGGKGINVARVISQMGLPVMATGFVGGHNGSFIEQGLTKQGISHDFVRVDGESRLCLNVIESTGASTELLEPGPMISSEEMVALKIKLLQLARKSKLVCFSGSLPNGVPREFYAELITLAKNQGATVFLDTSGEAFLHGVEALPFLIKPNEDEIAQWTGTTLDSEQDLLNTLKKLEKRGMPCISVSLGAQGSITAYKGKYYRVAAPKLEAINTVGCGDAYLAGMAIAISQSNPIEECLRLATAVGSANALTARAGYVNPGDVKRLFEEVKLECL